MNIGPPDEDGEDTKMITGRIIYTIYHAFKQAKEKEENEEVDKKKEPQTYITISHTDTKKDIALDYYMELHYIHYMECNNGYR